MKGEFRSFEDFSARCCYVAVVRKKENRCPNPAAIGNGASRWSTCESHRNLLGSNDEPALVAHPDSE